MMKEELKAYESLAKFLSQSLGDRYEVSLCDAEGAGEENGKDESEPREVGMIRDILASTELKKQDYIVSAADGPKTSIYIIRGKEDIEGFLCIREKDEGSVTVREVLDQILSPESTSSVNAEVENLMKEKIESIWQKYKSANAKMTKEVKKDFVRELFEAGMFRMKGIAPKVAEVSGISQASIYRYLAEVVEE